MRWVVEHSLAFLFLKTTLCIGPFQASLLNHQLPQLLRLVQSPMNIILEFFPVLVLRSNPSDCSALLLLYLPLPYCVFYKKKKKKKIDQALFFSPWLFLLVLKPLRAFQHLAFLIIPIQLSPLPPSHTLACLLVSVPTRPLSFIHWTNHLSSTFSHKTPSWSPGMQRSWRLFPCPQSAHRPEKETHR